MEDNRIVTNELLEEEKYNNLVKDHERYRGMIQAIKDCKGGENE